MTELESGKTYELTFVTGNTDIYAVLFDDYYGEYGVIYLVDKKGVVGTIYKSKIEKAVILDRDMLKELRHE